MHALFHPDDDGDDTAAKIVASLLTDVVSKSKQTSRRVQHWNQTIIGQ
jgi:hypothetical protein